MIRRWYYGATVFLIAQSLQAFGFVDRNVYGEWDGKPGDKLTQILNLLMIVASFALFGRNFNRLRSVKSGAILTLGLALYLLSSIFWSFNPGATLTQGVVYLTVVIGATGIATNLDADEFMKLVALVCGLTALVSLGLIVVSPGQVFTPEGDYRGIFSQKNVLGQAMMVGALASMHGLRARSDRRWLNGAILALVTIACFLSKSATSLSTIFVICGVHLVSALAQRGGVARMVGLFAGFTGAPVLGFALMFPDAALELIGKDPTLTGRTEIWDYVISDIYVKPVLGWGYNAFWSTSNPAAFEINEAVHWTVPQAHNGLLEILISVGVVGAIFFISILVRNFRLGLACLRTPSKALAWTTILSCASVVLVGISEMVLLNGLEASTLVFFVSGFSCERVLWLRTRQRAMSKRNIRAHDRMARPTVGPVRT